MKRKNILLRFLFGQGPTTLSSSLLLLRATIGILLFVAGSGKVLGWFGGFGMDKTILMFSKTGIPVPLIYISCFTEFIGGLFLAAGFLTRPVSVAVVINMGVATILTIPAGFFVPNGAVLPLTFLACAVAILLAGPMNYSIDHLLSRKILNEPEK